MEVYTVLTDVSRYNTDPARFTIIARQRVYYSIDQAKSAAGADLIEATRGGAIEIAQYIRAHTLNHPDGVVYLARMGSNGHNSVSNWKDVPR